MSHSLPPHRLPPLAPLRLFEAAGRLGGFTAAAAELSVTPSAVSHAVRTLEDVLGLPLFRRDARGLTLTPAGEDLLGEATAAFEGITRAMSRLKGTKAAGISVSVAPSFATRWLMPRLPALRRAHPALALRISTERERVLPGDGRFDAAIRLAEAPAGPGEWRHLADEKLVPVAAPCHARTPLPALLTKLPAIHVTSLRQDWAAWGSWAGIQAPDATRGLAFDMTHLALDAAAAGLGVVLARLPVAADDLARGTLVPMGPEMPTGTAYWLVTRPGLSRQTEGRLFTEWLAGNLREAAAAA